MPSSTLAGQIAIVTGASRGVGRRLALHLAEQGAAVAAVARFWLVAEQVSVVGWITRLVEHGLVRASLVPPPAIRRLRDLTRYRSALTAERIREKQRVEKVLGDAGTKLSVFVSDVLGVSGRAMLAALIAGERDPRVLAEHARARMRTKIPVLVEALTGRFDDYHAFLSATMLAHIDTLDATINTVTAHIEAQVRPFQALVDRLAVPGINQRGAQTILAEIGTDMSRFPTAGDLASWDGVCPGDNEAAASGSSTKNSYLHAQYRRLASRRGKTAHSGNLDAAQPAS